MTYNKVAKEISFISKPSKKGGKNHFVRVELVNGKVAEVWCDKDVVDLITTCKDLGIEPIQSFTLEQRVSDKNNKPYLAVVLKMFNNDEYFYFLPRPVNTMIDLLVAKTQSTAANTETVNKKK